MVIRRMASGNSSDGDEAWEPGRGLGRGGLGGGAYGVHSWIAWQRF